MLIDEITEETFDLFIEVKNKNGTSDRECSCGTWIDHWERLFGEPAGGCANMSCTNPAQVGGHIIKHDSLDRKEYIVPLCRECNPITDIFNVLEIDLIPAVDDSCKKY